MRRGGGRGAERDCIPDARSAAVAAGRSTSSADRRTASPSRAAPSPASPSRAAASPSRAAASPSRAAASPSRAAASPSRAAASPSLAAVSPSRAKRWGLAQEAGACRPRWAPGGPPPPPAGPRRTSCDILIDTDLFCAMCASSLRIVCTAQNWNYQVCEYSAQQNRICMH